MEPGVADVLQVNGERRDTHNLRRASLALRMLHGRREAVQARRQSDRAMFAVRVP
jgi:hypothetical protein